MKKSLIWAILLISLSYSFISATAEYNEEFDIYIYSGSADELVYATFFPFAIEGTAEIWIDDAAVYDTTDLTGIPVMSEDMRNIESWIEPGPISVLKKGTLVQVTGYLGSMVEIQTQEMTNGYISLYDLRFHNDNCSYRELMCDTWLVSSPEANSIGDEAVGRTYLPAGTVVRIVGTYYRNYMYLAELPGDEGAVGYVQEKICDVVNGEDDHPDSYTLQVVSNHKAPLYDENGELLDMIPSGETISAYLDNDITADILKVVYWYDDWYDDAYYVGYVNSTDVTFFILP